MNKNNPGHQPLTKTWCTVNYGSGTTHTEEG
jgi:hypothetical protein